MAGTSPISTTTGTARTHAAFQAVERAVFDAPSAGISLVRFRPRRAGLRFSRQLQCSHGSLYRSRAFPGSVPERKKGSDHERWRTRSGEPSSLPLGAARKNRMPVCRERQPPTETCPAVSNPRISE